LDVQVRGCCCGIPFGFGSMIVLAAGLLLWKLASPETFLGLSVETLSGGVAVAGAGLLLSTRMDRGKRREARKGEGPFLTPAGSE
jgi:hypothetical protein